MTIKNDAASSSRQRGKVQTRPNQSSVSEMANLWELRHLFVTVFLSTFAFALVNPVIPDVAVETLCHGKDECSLAIYLTGIQQAVTGLGSVVMMPLIGDLSDIYGRKTMLTIPMTLTIIPLVILAWKRTAGFYYAYYAFKTLFASVTDGGVACLTYGYLADNVPKVERSASFSVLFGAAYVANIVSNLVVRALSPSLIFKVAAVLSIVALIYMMVLLKDTVGENGSLERQLLMPRTETRNGLCGGSSKIKDFINHIRLLSSTTFALAALIGFFNMVAEDGANSILTYYLKARFHFNKDQFAIVFLILNVGAAVTNIFFMPIVGSAIGEETLLPFALFCGFLTMLLDSIAWSPMVPYIAASLGMFFSITTPCVRSIVSKQVGCHQQGIAQGFISGITSLAYVISPSIFSPLSALFLSERAPFPYPGFCILCIGFAYLLGFILSITMKVIPLFSRNGKGNGDSIVVA